MSAGTFTSDGVEIAYSIEGEGEPILLVHGFASNGRVNWASTGWIDVLTTDRRQVIVMDVRGHGRSGKPHDPEAYRLGHLAGDAARLLDHLRLVRVDVMGYSMGARIAAWLAITRPDLVRALVIGGLGTAMVEGVGGEEEIIAALEAPSLDEVDGDVGRAYRKFAEQTRSDLAALAACMRVFREPIAAAQLATIAAPVLIAVGEKDEVAGSADGLAAMIPGAEAFTIPNRDHLLATGAKPFKDRVLQFLEHRP